MSHFCFYQIGIHRCCRWLSRRHLWSGARRVQILFDLLKVFPLMKKALLICSLSLSCLSGFFLHESCCTACCTFYTEVCAHEQAKDKNFVEAVVISTTTRAIQLVLVLQCKTHKSEYIDFKCKLCCSIALWFCHGNTHYCDPCHRIAGSCKVEPCLIS